MTTRLPRVAAPLAGSLLALTLIAPWATAQESLDRFQLFNYCYPMRIVVEDLSSDAAEIGLTKQSIQVAVESRLRSARIYDLDSPDWLYIQVTVYAAAFSMELQFKKRVQDIDSGITGSATTWDAGATGTHGRDAGYIRTQISEYMDLFLVEFLRVNEEACEQR